MSTSGRSPGSSEHAASDVAPVDPAARASAHASNGAARAVSPDPTSIAPLAPRDAPTAATCASCGAPLAPDQRYCLACGQPASPVRLAFLDVLQGEYQPGTHRAGIPGAPPPVAYYAPPPEPDGALGALRRYSGLLALTGVLLAALLIGLLVGHWITGASRATQAAGKQVIEVKGLSGALVAPTSTTGAGSGSSANNSSNASGSQSHRSAKEAAKEEAKEAKEVAAAKAPPPVQKKTNPTSLQKLDKTTGKQHVKEVNEQFKGNEPIETGH